MTNEIKSLKFTTSQRVKICMALEAHLIKARQQLNAAPEMVKPLREHIFKSAEEALKIWNAVEETTAIETPDMTPIGPWSTQDDYI